MLIERINSKTLKIPLKSGHYLEIREEKPATWIFEIFNKSETVIYASNEKFHSESAALKAVRTYISNNNLI